MELINRIKKNRKGFTLVEIIVVLVILAILAAFTIPTMLGFVNDARGKAMIAEARTVYVAAQSTATEFGATTSLTDGALSTALSSAAVATEKALATPGTTAANKASAQMAKYIGTDISIGTTAGLATWTVDVGAGSAATTETAQVTEVEFTKDGYTITISDDSATVVKN
ncbi:type II secretion system protein [Acetobacterium sp. KB-1]|jgi:type IV pilus assembly protein PilA|uniref:type II secretion system protein n=1 Tax=Acetobacterium sp. KB-1 TaxID=2184575 RepID=UPI000DBEC749|nr:prepilin-type N-terminal cleavage/methylation domain-containing protein [Acetobacterium sp. KB-1]AWW27155.1 hypothetical protein DOZ58_11250 [Acetobacterium sp. KB-1]